MTGRPHGPRRPPLVVAGVRALTTPVIAAAVLVLALGGLSLRNHPAGMLGTDTGIKVATLQVMDRNNTLRPDLGYWAAPWDPHATVHSFRDTRHVGDAYVDVPTLPMVVASYPLWKLGGYRVALLLPILGVVAGAFIARGFARRVAGGDGWNAFWVVGLASPLVLYGLDLWEHTLGVATMTGAMLVLYAGVGDREGDRDPERDVGGRDAGVRAGNGWWRGLAGGALFGAAFSMRTEALVYGVVTFAILTIVLVRRKRLVDAVVLGGGGLLGFIALFLANVGLEVALVGQTIRSSRVSGTASAGGTALGVRAKEAVVTSFSPFPSFDTFYLSLGVCAGLALVAVAWWGRRPATRRLAVAAAGVVAFIFLTRVTLGLGFWPGLLATTPIAAVALARGWADARSRLVVLLALVPLPMVFFFQFPGGALPQWGGRYLLPSGFLLLAVGVALLPQLERWARVGFVALSIAVTCIGLAWMSSRTHQVAQAGELLAQRPEAVLVAQDGFLAREFAATYGEKDWLSTASLKDTAAAVAVVHASGRPTFALLTTDPTLVPPSFEGFHHTGTTKIPLIDPVDLTIISYAADGS